MFTDESRFNVFESGERILARRVINEQYLEEYTDSLLLEDGVSRKVNEW